MLSSQEKIHRLTSPPQSIMETRSGERDQMVRQRIELHQHRSRLGEIWINGEIDHTSIELVIMRLISLIQSEKFSRIIIFVNSPGGFTREGFAIVDFIRMSPIPVWTVAVGSAFSMGLGIFLAGDRRIALPNSQFMAHSLITSPGREKLYEQKEYIEFAEEEQEQHAAFYASRTKRQKAWWMKLFKGQDYYFAVDEALKIGVATDIITDFQDLFGNILSEEELERQATTRS